MIEIRKAMIEDIPTISRLAMVVIKQMDLPLSKKIGVENLLNLITKSAYFPLARYSFKRAIVAEKEGKVVGVAFAYPNEDEKDIDIEFQRLLKEKFKKNDYLFIDKEVFGEELYLDTLVVDKNARGLGIGTKLIKALPNIARKYNKKVIGLSVDKENPKAAKLYRKLGFKKVAKLRIGTHIYDHLHWLFAS